MVIPLFVGRDKSITALNEVMKKDKKIILVTQKNPEIDDPVAEDLYSFGCESKVLQLLKLPDGTVKVLVEGIDRVKILGCDNDKEYLATTIEVVKDKNEPKEDLLALSIAIVRKLENSGETEIKSSLIGEYIMDALSHLDQVAYVRFASVYKNFREAKDFEDFLDNLEDK